VVQDIEGATESRLDSLSDSKLLDQQNAGKHETDGELAAVPELLGSWGTRQSDAYGSMASTSVKHAQVLSVRLLLLCVSGRFNQV
jgi:hypothetical protein